MTAEIILFPRQTAGQPATGKRKLAGSPNAGFRVALAELKTSMRILDGSLQRHRLRLDTLRAGLDRVRADSD